mgnify:CR=1 FL=1
MLIVSKTNTIEDFDHIVWQCFFGAQRRNESNQLLDRIGAAFRPTIGSDISDKSSWPPALFTHGIIPTANDILSLPE